MDQEETSMDAYDARGKRTGRVDHDGTVYNSPEKYIGRVDHNDLVFNSYNSFVGQVQDNGIVRLSNGEIMARVDDEESTRHISLSMACIVARRRATQKERKR
jgi:hypothetical protein